MKLWHISQTENNGYDTYDSAVVAAETEDAARRWHPGEYFFRDGKWWFARDGAQVHRDWSAHDWVEIPAVGVVAVRLIGEAVEGTKAGVVCASFNAG
jgi:hypothetical protein